MWCKGTNYNSYFRSISCIFAFQRYNYLFWRIAAEEDRYEKQRVMKMKKKEDEKQREMKNRGDGNEKNEDVEVHPRFIFCY